MKDRIHQLTMIAHNRGMTGNERERLGPTQTDADTQLANLGVLGDPARVACHVQTRDTYAPGNACDAHNIVEHGSRRLTCPRPMAACLKADAVNGCIHLWLTDDLLDLIGQFAALCEID